MDGIGQHAGHKTLSPRATLRPLDTGDLSLRNTTASPDTHTSHALSPLSTVLSPACSDVDLSVDAAESGREPIPATLRRAMSLSALTAEAKQRRKRSRTTPEQLAKLEEYFAVDQSPTSARRRDIARELGLDERQTQIWFQNRRAKVKLLAKRKARAEERLELLPAAASPALSSPGLDAGVYSLIHEEEEITIIPCTDLKIGAWRRVASPQHTLVAYVCEARRCVAWFIRSEGLSFKMEVPFDIVVEAHFLNVSPGVGSASFTLGRPPTFFVEKPADYTESARRWHVSGDWTEGRQASSVLQHVLVGPAYQLWSLVNSVSPSGTSSEASLSTPTPSISDAGSSPEVYPRSCDSPVEPHPQSSSMPLRRPSSLSSLRVLHHPSLERLRPSRPTSVPMFYSPLWSIPPLDSLQPAGSEGHVKASSVRIDTGGGQSRAYTTAPQGMLMEQLPSLQLAMPSLPRLNYAYDSRAISPHGYASEPPPSAASTPGCYSAPSPIWESPSVGPSTNPAERPGDPSHRAQLCGFPTVGPYRPAHGSC
ncbi:homeobox-domain-containing protein [Trametes cingulata]|nr:homeobox-domain-containing protein [Trametes cingulata]